MSRQMRRRGLDDAFLGGAAQRLETNFIDGTDTVGGNFHEVTHVFASAYQNFFTCRFGLNTRFVLILSEKRGFSLQSFFLEAITQIFASNAFVLLLGAQKQGIHLNYPIPYTKILFRRGVDNLFSPPRRGSMPLVRAVRAAVSVRRRSSPADTSR